MNRGKAAADHRIRERSGLPRIGIWSAIVLFLFVSCAANSSAQVVTEVLHSPWVNPVEIVTDPANQMAYIMTPIVIINSGPGCCFTQPGSLAFYDPATGNFGTYWDNLDPVDIKVNATSNKIYIANQADSDPLNFITVTPSVTVINGADNSVQPVALNTSAYALAIDEPANKIYVAAGVYEAGGQFQLDVIDGNTNAITATLPIPGSFNNITGMAVDSSLHKVYAIAGGSNDVIALDTATNTFTSIPTAGLQPISIVVNSGTHHAIVVDEAHDSDPYSPGIVAVIDTTTNQLITTRYVGQGPGKVALNPVTNQAFILNSHDPALSGAASLTVLDEASLTLLEPHAVPLGEPNSGNPRDLAVNSATNMVYVSMVSSDNETMIVVHGSSYRPAAVSVGFLPGPIAVDSVSNTIYVGGNAIDNDMEMSNYFAVIDGTGGQTAVPTMFPSNLYFQTALEKPSAPQTVYLANTGGVPMPLANLIYDSPFQSALLQQNDCPNPLPALHICPISLTYTPQTANPDYQTGPFNAIAASGSMATANIFADVIPIPTSIAFTTFAYAPPSFTIYGRITATSSDPILQVAGLTVEVKFDGVTHVVTTDQYGDFGAQAAAAHLTSGTAYPITALFPGNTEFNATSTTVSWPAP